MVRVWRGPNLAVEVPLKAAEADPVGPTMRRALDGASELTIGLVRAGMAKL